MNELNFVKPTLKVKVEEEKDKRESAVSVDRTRDLQIFSLTLSQLSYPRKRQLHQPGIEPGSVPWQGTILPLDHWCLLINYPNQIK